MKNLVLLASLFCTVQTWASIDQCPASMTGKFFCHAVEGSNKDMTMEITQTPTADGKINYKYLYLQVGLDPLNLSFMASDQGEPNPQLNMIGTCYHGYYVNTLDGVLTERSLLNYVDADGNYQVVRNDANHTAFLTCPPVQP